MISYTGDYEQQHLLSRVATLYYVEEQNQSTIASNLGLSTAKVNRLLKQAREQGMVEITVHTPFQHLFEIENSIAERYGIPEAIVVPQLADDPDAALQTVGREAAKYLLQHLKDGDTICISGGKTMNAIVHSLEAKRSYDVQVVPATGARQGRHHTDVNYLAAELADRLGGEAYKIHAPVFVDSVEERDALLNMRQIREVLDMARQAQIALVGVGSVIPGTSSYFDLMSNVPLSEQAWHDLLEEHGVSSEIFAYLCDRNGRLCLPEFNQRVIGLQLADLQAIPSVIGTAVTAEKGLPIHSALRGNHLKTLITDESTARSVLDLAEEDLADKDLADGNSANENLTNETHPSRPASTARE